MTTSLEEEALEMCNATEGIRKEAEKRGRARSSGVRCTLCSATVLAVVGIVVVLVVLAAIWGLAQIISTVTPPQGSPGGDGPQVVAFATTSQAPQSKNRENDLTTTYEALQTGRYEEAERLANEASEKAPEYVWTDSSSRKAGTRQTLKIGDVEYGFCWIPAGEFDVGSPLAEQKAASANAKEYGINWDYKEERQHHVKLTKGFWMLETETTQALYQEVMGTNPSYFEGGNLPVEQVSWKEAMEFCAELTKRLPKGVNASLPTEAQWEYACRAGTSTAFSFGDALNGDNANCDGDYPYGTTRKGMNLEKTSPVKSYAPNAWGLYDMHGNVWEWVLDYYGDYATGTVVDPKGPNDASDRVSRGGSWGSYAWDCRSASRFRSGPGYRNYYLGFRFLLSCD